MYNKNIRMNKYYIYFENKEGNFRVLYNDDSFETLIHKPKETTYHHYEMMKGYAATDEGLLSLRLT